ncbi:hypothetical protein S40288_01014 [Stachybotrys chartarum IBT 40288]|nr:hypothetical protein S40288_01014 [Stachybotrys chartarum IBT 40288]
MALLARGGAPVNAQNNLGNTPLHVAAMHGFDEGTQWLLVTGTDRNKRNNSGEIPLQLALAFDNSAVVETLLAAGVDALTQENQRSTPFHYAAQWESTEAIKLLLFDGYSPNGINEDQDTALNIAIRAGNEDMVRELVNHGAVVRPSDVVAGAQRGLSELRMGDLGVTGPINLPVLRCPAVLSSRRGVPHLHWPSFNDPQASSAKCPMCNFFVTEMVQHEVFRSASGPLFITAELCSDKPWEKSGTDTLSISLSNSAPLT